MSQSFTAAPRKPDLTGVKVFVGGPIQHAIEADGFFSPLQGALRTVIAAVEEAGGTVFSAHVAENFGADTALFTPDDVTLRDFGWMQQCDVFVPLLPVDNGEFLRTDGTHIELGWASALRRPIKLVTQVPVGPSPSASHLLRGLASVAEITEFDVADVAKDPSGLLDSISLSSRGA